MYVYDDHSDIMKYANFKETVDEGYWTMEKEEDFGLKIGSTTPLGFPGNFFVYFFVQNLTDFCLSLHRKFREDCGSEDACEYQTATRGLLAAVLLAGPHADCLSASDSEHARLPKSSRHEVPSSANYLWKFASAAPAALHPATAALYAVRYATSSDSCTIHLSTKLSASH